MKRKLVSKVKGGSKTQIDLPPEQAPGGNHEDFHEQIPNP